jgi:acylphosphatase
MKLQIKIVGPKVHDVGYRVFLSKTASALAIPGLSAYNWESDKVIALVEGEPERVAAFLKKIEGTKPELAEVSSITSEEYHGDVGRASEFAASLTLEQFSKAIPILKQIAKNTDLIPEIAQNTRLIPEIAENARQIPKIVSNTEAILEITKVVSENTKSTPQILEEIKGLREDI